MTHAYLYCASELYVTRGPENQGESRPAWRCQKSI